MMLREIHTQELINPATLSAPIVQVVEEVDVVEQFPTQFVKSRVASASSGAPIPPGHNRKPRPPKKLGRQTPHVRG